MTSENKVTLNKTELQNNLYQDISKFNLTPSQKDALEIFQNQGLPNRRVEDWKYTNPAKGLPTGLGQGNLKRNSTAPTLEEVSFEKGTTKFKSIYFVDGLINFAASDLDLNESEVSGSADASNDSIVNLSRSIQKNVFKLDIKKNTQVKIQVIHYFTGNETYSTDALEINVASSAELTLFEQHLQNNEIEENTFYTSSVTLNLEANAKTDHIILNELDKSSFVFHQVISNVNKDAYYKNYYFNLGSPISRFNVLVNLQEQNATTDVHGLYTLKNNQHGDHFSIINHLAPHTYSNQLYKGILDDNSQGVFSGKILIHKDAQLCDANQLNKNLLLSKKAQINTRPQLEVYADDVKCAHGATIGQLSDEETFYLTSRGIGPERAKKILCHAFGAELVLKIEDENIKEHLEKRLFEKFEKYAFEHL